MKTTFPMLFLFLLSAGSAFLFRSVREDPIPLVHAWSHSVPVQARDAGVPLVDGDGVQAILENGSHLLIDARASAAYAEGHIPTALSLPEDAFDGAIIDLEPLLSPEVPLLVYCEGLDCDAALRVSLRLREAGISNVLLYAEGFSRWTEEGRDVE